jgi:hypothetical protein
LHSTSCIIFSIDDGLFCDQNNNQPNFGIKDLNNHTTILKTNDNNQRQKKVLITIFHHGQDLTPLPKNLCQIHVVHQQNGVQQYPGIFYLGVG